MLFLFVLLSGPPELPVNFRVLPHSATPSSIGFSWTPGFHGGADQTFHIDYRSEGQEWKEGARLFGGKVSNQQLQIEVNGLDADSPYLFRIYASNQYGESDKSGELLEKTTQGQSSKSKSNTMRIMVCKGYMSVNNIRHIVGIRYKLRTSRS